MERLTVAGGYPASIWLASSKMLEAFEFLTPFTPVYAYKDGEKTDQQLELGGIPVWSAQVLILSGAAKPREMALGVRVRALEAPKVNAREEQALLPAALDSVPAPSFSSGSDGFES